MLFALVLSRIPVLFQGCFWDIHYVCNPCLAPPYPGDVQRARIVCSTFTHRTGADWSLTTLVALTLVSVYATHTHSLTHSLTVPCGTCWIVLLSALCACFPPAGAIFGTESEIHIDGNVSFEANSAGWNGGEASTAFVGYGLWLVDSLQMMVANYFGYCT